MRAATSDVLDEVRRRHQEWKRNAAVNVITHQLAEQSSEEAVDGSSSCSSNLLDMVLA